MKANEVPEKIYLSSNSFKISDYVTKTLTTKMDGNLEYLNADVFIEKACVKLKKLMYDNLMFQGRLNRAEVIDTFVEEFRKCVEESNS